MSYQKRRIDEMLEARYRKALRNADKFKPNIPLTEVPEGVRVSNALSNRAIFHSCRYRRKGYIFNCNPKDFARLDERPLTDEYRLLLEDRWLRGVMWMPPVITIGPTVVDNVPAWEVISNVNWWTATFLAEKGWPKMTVQALEKEDVPATQEGLNRFRSKVQKESVLFNHHGVGLCDPIKIYYPRATF